MKKTWIVTALISVLLSGCFIEITSPTGGRVVTDSGSLDCGPGETCVIEIADDSFNETFRAVPDADMVLDGWRSGKGYFSPKQKDSIRLFTVGFGNLEGFSIFLESDLTFYLEPVFKPDPYPEIAAHRVTLDQQGILDNVPAVVDYGQQKGLSLYNLDAILRAEPGSTMRYAHDNELWAGNGENRIEDFALSFGDAIAVPADPSKVTYPDDYQVEPSTVSIEDPYCDLEPGQIVIPEEFLGNYALPEIDVIPASQPFGKMAYIKDVWERQNASFIQTCFADARDAMRVTLQRLKQANIDTVVLFPWTTVDTSGEKWRIDPVSNMPDEDLAWIANTASAMGLKVFWRNQIQFACVGPRDSSDECFLPEPTEENILKTYDAMEVYLSDRGAFLEELGVDGASLVGDFWTDPKEVITRERYIEQSRRHIEAMKSNFSGMIMHDLQEPLTSDPDVSALVDMWEFSVFYDEVAPFVDSLNVETAVPFIRGQLEYYQGLVDGKMVVLPAAASRGNFLTDIGLYVEETFCTDSTDSIFQEPGKCVQEEMATDLSLQAILYQATLEAAFSIPQFPPQSVAVDYWLTDGILPAYPWTFANLAYSIRNKPAEQIVRRWFDQP